MLHNGNKQDPCLLQTLHKQDWRKGFFWAIADAEATARKELLFCNGGASFHKPDYFSVVIAENRPLAVKKKKKTTSPQQAPLWSWNSSISPHNSWTCCGLAALSEIQ